MGVPPNHPVVMDDHDLVLKPMVTLGSLMTQEIPIGAPMIPQGCASDAFSLMKLNLDIHKVVWKSEACKPAVFSQFHGYSFMICETFIPEDTSSHCLIVTTGPRNRISETLLHHIPLQRQASQHHSCRGLEIELFPTWRILRNRKSSTGCSIEFPILWGPIHHRLTDWSESALYHAKVMAYLGT